MDEKEKKEETKKEEVPAWAQNLQNSLDSLPDRLSEILSPKNPEPTPDPEPDPGKPLEIPVPEIPKQETPEPEPLTDPEPEEPKKKKGFLDWLL